MLIKTKACTLTTHIPSRLCQCYISVLFLSSSVNLSRCSNLFKCVSMMFVLSFRFLHHGVAHWNCIVFPGGERNCGVHELICVRKGRADQSSGRLTLDPSLQPPPPLHLPHQHLSLLNCHHYHLSLFSCCTVSRLCCLYCRCPVLVLLDVITAFCSYVNV